MLEKDVELALLNIVKFGDTDIFPFPVESHVFHDKKVESTELILEMNRVFFEIIETTPPVNINTFSPAGYTGFRWATQIEPVWNAYFLSLVISIADKIEASRIPASQGIVHSYRYSPDTATGQLFNQEFGWSSFQRESLRIVKEGEYNYVVICDVADFYNRLYHHRLDNAVRRLTDIGSVPAKLKTLLQKFSNSVSYGLPIGGPAARILAELSFDSTDRILLSRRIKFVRFVDDIHLFCRSQEEAHAQLNLLAMKLMANEGLTLQKHKTQILTKAEFVSLVASRVNAESDDAKVETRARFMSLPIRYDPYSPTADDDYQKIKAELQEFDVLDLLNEELRKTKVHQQFSKHLLKALTVLDDLIVSKAITAIMDRIELLYPIFPNLMISIFSNYERLDPKAKEAIMRKLRELVAKDSYMLQVELNVAYMVRVLGKEASAENQEVIIGLFHKFSSSVLVKSWIMQVFTNWRLDFWLSDLKQSFGTMTKWERRVFILSSFVLGDEGKHWRDHNKRGFSKSEQLVRDWGAERFQQLNWQLPL